MQYQYLTYDCYFLAPERNHRSEDWQQGHERQISP